jgi:hypothetical protein
MNLLGNLFKKKENKIKSYDEFWQWFEQNQKLFYSVVKDKGDIQRFFFAKLAEKLNELKDGMFFLVGMFDKNTVELILTPDGIIKNIWFVEELIAAAPEISGWRFTALKPPSGIENIIEMGGHKFSGDNISFYPNIHPDFPDEVDMTAVHSDYTEQNKSRITSGVYIFLDSFLGELNFINNIDNLKVRAKGDSREELVPIEKIKDYLTWRQAEFIEKYEGMRHDTENDSFVLLQAELKSGNILLATVNTALLEWDGKASHPWILHVKIKYDGSKTNGLPDEDTSALLIAIEDELIKYLKDVDGYLYIGHETAEGSRDIYFACKDFRKPSKVTYQVQGKFAGEAEIDFSIYKDKYWQSFNRFR